jgi:hypothetical protein
MLETQSWNRTASDALWSGAWAAVASAVVLSWRGHREADDAAAPINGPSQWFWGRTAPSARGFSVKHTVVGYLTHHFAATFWALWFERVRERVGHPAAVALGTAAVANVVDYVFTPKRLQPGYERRLSKRSLALAYGAVALGLAASTLVRRPRA